RRPRHAGGVRRVPRQGAAALGRAGAARRRQGGVTAVRFVIRTLLAAALAAFAAPVLAQSYPTRPIKLLVSFPPGGASDLIARVIGAALTERLGQPIVVENRP